MNKEHVIILTKGASGSIYYANLLRRNGFYFGSPYPKLNGHNEREASQFSWQVGQLVKYKGNYEWDFDNILSSEPTDQFKYDLNTFLGDLNNEEYLKVAWKVPISIVAFDWLLKTIKNVKIIVNIRDPRDFIYGDNGQLGNYFFKASSIPYDNIPENKISFASWKCTYDYVYEVVNKSIYKNNIIIVRLEDMILKQDDQIKNISNFLENDLKSIPVRYNPFFNIDSSDVINVPLLGFPICKYLYDDKNEKCFDKIEETMNKFRYTINKSDSSYWIPDKNKEDEIKKIISKEIEFYGGIDIAKKESKKINVILEDITNRFSEGSISEFQYEIEINNLKQKNKDLIEKIYNS